MALYFGNGEKVNIRCIDGVHSLNIPDAVLAPSEVILYSSDNYVLMSSDGYRLVEEEEEEEEVC